MKLAQIISSVNNKKGVTNLSDGFLIQEIFEKLNSPVTKAFTMLNQQKEGLK